MRMLKQLLFGLGCLVTLPSLAFAQVSITGVVKDSSGAVLPGVTVEASSDVLIERVRSAVTDGSGTYRIVHLRAGTYVVTFSLTGFSTVNTEFLDFRVNNGVPNQITVNINAFKQKSRMRYDALYAQEQWTLGRMTVPGALRFDYARSYFPEQTVGAQRFLPTTVTYPESDGVTGIP
jgi:hypothetical protein